VRLSLYNRIGEFITESRISEKTEFQTLYDFVKKNENKTTKI